MIMYSEGSTPEKNTLVKIKLNYNNIVRKSPNVMVVGTSLYPWPL